MKVNGVFAVDVYIWYFVGYFVFMKLKLLSWNVTGLNDPKKREVLKNWLRKWKVDVVCL